MSGTMTRFLEVFFISQLTKQLRFSNNRLKISRLCTRQNHNGVEGREASHNSMVGVDR